MIPEKITKNLEFDLIYADGEKKRVTEGILFEAEPDGHTMLHIGTSRPEVIRAFFEAVIEAMNEIHEMNSKPKAVPS